MQRPTVDVAHDRDDTRVVRAPVKEGPAPPLLILSADTRLIALARAAAPTAAVFTDEPDIDRIVDLLPQIEAGVLIVDATGSRSIPRSLPQLARHFPELVVIVVGNKEDSGALLRLTAEGCVFRFLLKPLSYGQAALAIEAAIARHVDLKSPDARRLARAATRGYIAVYGPFAVGLLATLGGLWFAADRLTRDRAPPARIETARRELPQPVHPVAAELALAQEAFDAGRYAEPRGESALDFYRNALALDPNDEIAQDGVHRVADKLLERAAAALTAEQLEEATSALEMARAIEPSHPRLAFLDIRLARERERLRLTQEREP